VAETTKTWEEWASEKGWQIFDPDGFRDLPNDHPYTEGEFDKNVLKCTATFGRSNG
jgi:hypothetical protein